MKQYILLFLLFMSNVCFAPNLPNISKETPCTKEENLAIREELKTDSIDISYIKTLPIKEKNRFTKDERKKLRDIAKELGIKKSKWLYKIIYIESRLDPKAVNYQSCDILPNGDKLDAWSRVLKGRATGLIQWIPSSAIACGTTTKELYKMTVSEQLDFVKVYLKLALNGKKVNNFTDLYLAVFSPSAVGKSDSYVIGYKNSKIVSQNKNYMNSDSTITKKDIRLAVMDALL